MITGTYHGAIFSLAQGVPVIGVAKSREYFDKLSELADEFGPSCHVILLGDEQVSEKLAAAIDKAWSTAEDLRPDLLRVAARQVEQQHSAYQLIFELVTARMKDGKKPTAEASNS